MAATPTGKGYWLVASDGGIFSFGDAHFYGSMGGTRLNQPVVGIAPTPTGDGYWLAARDGGIFNFGDAPFYRLFVNYGFFGEPIVGIAARPQGDGYWLVSSLGSILAFGNASRVAGDAHAADVSKPIVGIASTCTGAGFWVVGRGTPATLPGQVTSVRTWHGGSGEITVSWDGVPGATGYRVSRGTTPAGPFSIAADVNLVTGKITKASGVLWVYAEAPRYFQYDELIAAPGDHHRYYYVTAYNAYGDGPASVVVCGAPPGATPC
jgi:hypothetical protein